MSFLEWWGESVDPGKVGQVDLRGQHEVCQSRTLIVLRLVVVLIGLPVLWGLAISTIALPVWQAGALVVGGTLIYMALGYLLRPEPDMDNLGWCGGLMDHPWRYSDDINRMLVALAVVLGPGRFVAESLLDGLTLFKVTDSASASQPGSDADMGERLEP